MKHPDQDVYCLTFRVLPGRVPGARRAAQLLKYALRVQGLVCTEAVQLHPDRTPTPLAGTAGAIDEVFGREATEGPA